MLHYLHGIFCFETGEKLTLNIQILQGAVFSFDSFLMQGIELRAFEAGALLLIQTPC